MRVTDLLGPGGELGELLLLDPDHLLPLELEPLILLQLGEGLHLVPLPPNGLLLLPETTYKINFRLHSRLMTISV